MASTSTVHVSNINPATTEKEVRDFFSFCGKISNLTLTSGSGGPQSASVTFEKPTAAKTALLLDNTQLKESLVQVSSEGNHDESAEKGGAAEAAQGEDLDQEDKPRSRIIAEYLAHGYVVSDKAVERAIALDTQHGFTNRFTTALQQFDQKYQVTPKVQNVDQKYAITEKAQTSWSSLSSYFEKSLETPTGQKVMAFYRDGHKQVMDVHNEARRLADLKGGPKATPQQVPGTSKTECTCAGVDGKCGCEPGKCACSGCSKNHDDAAGAAGVSEKSAAGP